MHSLMMVVKIGSMFLVTKNVHLHCIKGVMVNAAIEKWSNLKDPFKHIEKRMNAQSSQQVLQNRLRLKTSIIATKWLAKQACTFRCHDESVNSLNRGNFIELIKLLTTMNEEINKVVLENAPKNWVILLLLLLAAR